MNDTQVNPHTGSLITVPVHLEHVVISVITTKTFEPNCQIFLVGCGQKWSAMEGARVVIGRVDVPY